MKEGQEKMIAVLCWTLCFVVCARGRFLRDVTTSQGEPESLPTFQVTKITRQSSNNGHDVELHLTGADRDLPTAYLLHNWYQQPENLGNPSNGILKFHVDSQVEAIQLLHPRGFHGIKVTFTDSSPTEQILPHIDITLQEGRQLAFQQGHNTDAHVRVSVNMSSSTEVRQVLMYRGVAAKSKTENQVVELHSGYSEFPLQVLNHTETIDGGSSYLRINTSAGNVEGLLELDAFAMFKCVDETACLASSYVVHEDVPLFQEGHEGPFADNYIGLMKYANHHQPDPVECWANDPYSCRIRCEFIGDNPTSVQFEKVSGDDLGPYETVSVANGGFRGLGVLTLNNVPSPGEAEFRCTSSSGQQMASHTINIKILP